MKNYVIKVIKNDPIYIEGSFHISAASKKKVKKALKNYGEYEIVDIKEAK